MSTVKGGILAAMERYQDAHGYLTEDGMREIAAEFGKPVNEVYDTASFYSMIRLEPAGKTLIEVCHGAPCHITGSDAVVKALEEAIGIRIGETSADGQFTLRYTECLGQCGEGPVVLVNGKLYTQVTPEMAAEIVKGGAAK